MKYELMEDTVTPSAITPNPWATAGYSGGNWPDYPALERMFPNAYHLLVLIGNWQGFVGDAMDAEPGDDTVDQCAEWLPHAKPINLLLPCGYTSASSVEDLIIKTEKQGLKRREFFVWSAHYTFRPHICGPNAYGPGQSCGYPQADFTQFSDRWDGRNLDGSWVPKVGIFKGTKPKVILPPDPHHYRWFAGEREKIGLPGGPFDMVIEGKHIKVDERDTVMQYDKLRAEQRRHVHPHTAELEELRERCYALSQRIDSIAHEQQKGHLVPWTDFRRFGWRKEQLVDRADGRLVAR